MSHIENRVIEQFGNKVRVRVCGLCIEKEKVLLVNHNSLNEQNEFWSPPGGGLEFGQSSSANLKREFFEETGIIIEIENFLFVHEYLNPPLHAIELFFNVKRICGNLKVGTDPELIVDKQIIIDARFVSIEEIKKIAENSLHQIFHNIDAIDSIEKMDEYIIWEK